MARSLWAVGVGASGSGYPNGAALIELLSRDKSWAVRNLVRWLPEDVHLWRLGKGSIRQRGRVFLHIAARAALLPADLIRARRAGATVFAPYPALFTLAVARCLPKRFRPRIVADCFISIWDSGFADRNIGAASGALAGAVKAIEAWCLRAADAVFVDTFENARFFERELVVDPDRIHVAPLAIDVEKLLALDPALPSGARPLRVLYVGTFVPLHGFHVIVGAMRDLSLADHVDFRVVGDGQDASLLEAAMREGFACGVEWIREWQRADDLVAHYAWADVCLGVFGASGKSTRVLPFKLYAAFAAGRAVVTQEPMGLPVAEYPPAKRCGCAGTSLADALRTLATNRDQVSLLGQQGRMYFREWLSGSAIKGVWSHAWEQIAGRSR